MNTYHVYYRYTELQFTDYYVVVTNSIQSAIDTALEDIPNNEKLELSEIDICHVEKVEESGGNQMTPDKVQLNIERLRSVNLYLNQVLDYDKRIDIQSTIYDVMYDLRESLEEEE